jgi:hypothetical protein
MKEQKTIDLTKISQEQVAVEEVTEQLEKRPTDSKLWTEEFSATGEK